MFALRIVTEILFERNDQKDWSEKPGRRQRPNHLKNHQKKTRKVCVKDCNGNPFCEVRAKRL
jgi:hypothetical protein